MLKVLEDSRIAKVEDMLPLANCGGCGFPGCRNDTTDNELCQKHIDMIEGVKSYLKKGE